MRFVSHWPLGVPLLFLARWFPRRKRKPKGIVPLAHREWWPAWGVPPWNGRTVSDAGTRPDGGYRKLFAYTQGKVAGMRTLATAITAGCSSLSRRGARSADIRALILRARVNSYTGPGLSTDATATPGENGAPLERAA